MDDPAVALAVHSQLVHQNLGNVKSFVDIVSDYLACLQRARELQVQFARGTSGPALPLPSPPPPATALRDQTAPCTCRCGACSWTRRRGSCGWRTTPS